MITSYGSAHGRLRRVMGSARDRECHEAAEHHSTITFARPKEGE